MAQTGRKDDRWPGLPRSLPIVHGGWSAIKDVHRYACGVRSAVCGGILSVHVAAVSRSIIMSGSTTVEIVSSEPLFVDGFERHMGVKVSRRLDIDTSGPSRSARCGDFGRL